MEIVVLARDTEFNFLKTVGENISWTFTNNPESFFINKNADAYFDLRPNACEDYNTLFKPVFINNMTETLLEKNYKEHVLRINAWPGFLETDTWEIAEDVSANAIEVLQKLNKKYIAVPDEPGFVTARIIAMMINEAYYAKDENVSSEAEIDIAMKLGTNYPYGPFEWCNKIGIQAVYKLLQKLSETDERFLPSAGLAAANNNLQWH